MRDPPLRPALQRLHGFGQHDGYPTSLTVHTSSVGTTTLTGHRTSPRSLVLTVVALALAGACVAPARTFEDFEGKAVTSAESAASEARTAILTSSVAERSRLPGPTTSVIMADQRRPVRAVSANLRLDPTAGRRSPMPPWTELLPGCATRPLDLIAYMRIAARRSDPRRRRRFDADLETGRRYPGIASSDEHKS